MDKLLHLNNEGKTLLEISKKFGISRSHAYKLILMSKNKEKFSKIEDKDYFCMLSDRVKKAIRKELFDDENSKTNPNIQDVCILLCTGRLSELPNIGNRAVKEVTYLLETNI